MFPHTVARVPARRRTVAVAATFLFFVQAFTAVFAQSPAPLPNPNLQFLSAGGIGQTSGMVLQRDGKLVIASGGSSLFERIGGVVGQRRLARLNADGSLDTSFTLDTNGPTGVDPGGDFVYVSGGFTTIGGVARNGLARFSVATGQLDNAWNPTIGTPTYLVADSTNATYVISNNLVEKLDAVTGASVASWQGRFLPEVTTLTTMAVYQSALYVVGTVPGTVRTNRILKLSIATGAIDASFSPSLDAIDFPIRNIAVGPTGDVYVYSVSPPAFLNTGAGGPTYPAQRRFLRLLAASGAVAPEWTGPTQGFINLVVTSDGIFGIRGISVGDSLSRWGVMRYNATTGQQDPNWTFQAENTFGLISGAIAASGTDLYYGGWFSYYGTTRRSGLAKLSITDGSVLPSFVPDLRASRLTFSPITHTLPDGGAVMGGDFVEVNGIPTDGLIRIRPDGAFDPSWRPSAIKGVVSALRTMGSFIYASGFFSEVGTSPRPNFARFNAADGSLDTNFQPPAVDGVLSYFASDGNDVFVTGSFRNVAGSPRVCAAKLNGVTGAYIPQWAPVFNIAPTTPASSCSGFQRIDASAQHVYLAPLAVTVNVGPNPRRLSRVSNITGAVDPSWDPNPNNAIIVRILAYNNALYVFGNYNAIAGQNTRAISRFLFDQNGAIDNNFINSTDISGPGGFNLFQSGGLAAGPSGIYVAYSWLSGTGANLTFQQLATKFSLANGSVDTTWQPFQGTPTTPAVNGSTFAPLIHSLTPSTVVIYGYLNSFGTTPRQGVAFVPTSTSSLLALPRPDIKLERNADLDGVGVQTDGKLIVSGDFTSVDGLPRTNLVRLNANGSLDTSFNVSVEGRVFAIRVAGNFAYLGGNFTRIGGVPRSQLARINLTTGALDGGWNPNLQPADVLSDIAVDANGNLFVYGGIMSIGGISGVQVAKILPTGQADPLFRGFPDVFARQILVAGNGTIYVTGTQPNQQRETFRIFKLNPVNGSIDPTWSPTAQSIDMIVREVAVNALGDVYVGGQTFGNAVGGQTFTAPRNFAKLSAASGAVLPQWAPPATSAVSSISTDAAGNVYAVRENFFSLEFDGTPMKLDGVTGAMDPSFTPPAIGGGITDFGLLVMPDGVLIGGGFNSVGSARTGPIAKLNLANGALLTNFSTNLRSPGFLTVATQLSTGKIMLGGYFSKIDGQEINNLARLNADGSVDATWTVGSSSLVNNIQEHGGSLYLATLAPSPPGYTLNFGPNFVTPQSEFLTRLDLNTGARDSRWGFRSDGRVRSTAFDAASNSLYLIGTFTNVNNAYRPCVAKVDATTGILDPAWAPPLRNNTNNQNLGFGLNCGRSLAISGNSIYMGLFTSPGTAGGNARFVVNGQNRFLARANLTTGAIDPTWDPAPNGQVTAMTLSGNDLYITGAFNTISGVPTSVAKYNAATGLIDSSFINTSQRFLTQVIRAQSGSVFLAGTSAGSNFDFSKAFVSRLTSTGTLDTTWSPDFEEVRNNAQFGTFISAYGTDAVLVASGFQRVGNQARNALAAFSARPQSGLTLNIRGRGTVVLQSTGAPQNATCADCASGTYAYAFDTGSTVTLTAISTPSAVFNGWSGGTGSASCTGTGACVVPLSAASSITAAFRQPAGAAEQ
jgi:uncharacterized delta-60 repeat protein